MSNWKEWPAQRAVRCTGTAGGYASGCRCGRCTDAATESKRDQRARARQDTRPRRRTSWRDDAACKGYDTAWWYALPGTDEHDQALLLCDTCPVQADCRAEAMEQREQGLWGLAWRSPWISTHYGHSTRRWKILRPRQRETA